MSRTPRNTRISPPRFVLALVVALAATASGWSQTAPRTPEQRFEEQIQDLVDRYEEARTLLLEQIRINSELFSQDDIDAAVADLEAEVERLQQQNLRLRDDYKALQTAYRDANDEVLAYKAELTSSQREAAAEIATLNAIISGTEEENLLQVGATFSPSGSLGVIGIFNLPGTNVGLVTGASWVLREQAFSASFGVTFSYLPQGVIIEGWERLRARLRRDPILPEEAESASSAGQS